MIEAVGHENLPTYFGTIGRVLKPGGRAVIQAISVPDDRWASSMLCTFFLAEGAALVQGQPEHQPWTSPCGSDGDTPYPAWLS